MKKISTITLLAVFALAITTSCVSNLEMTEEGGRVGQVKLSAQIEDKTSTKVDDSGFLNGDSFGVFIVNHTAEDTPGSLLNEGNQADNVQYTYNEGNNLWTPKKTVIYKDASTRVNIYGYYPYDSDVSDVHAYGFSVKVDQRKDATPGGMNGFEASDFLFGKVENVVPSENTVSIVFRHKMASVSVNLTKGDGWENDEAWESATKDVLIGNTITHSVIDLGTGTVTPTGEASQLNLIPKKLNGDNWKAVVVPQIVQAGKELVIVTVNGMVSTFTKDVEYQYYQGKMNTITLSVNKKSVDGIALELVAESILPWEVAEELERDVRNYLVINCPEAGKLEEVLATEGYDFTSIKSLKLTGEINSIDFFLMKTKMDNLEALNLADVTIMAYEKEQEDWIEPIANVKDCIPALALQNKTSLNTIVLPKKLVEIGPNAFSGTYLKGHLVIPEGTVLIGGQAFADIPTLNAQIVFPSTLRVIEGGAFYNTTVIGELHLPDKLRYIGGESFKRTSISGNIHLPDSLEFIGEAAFQNCQGLTGSLIIPERIKEIPWGCFEDCSGLNGELVLNENLEKIDNYALQWCGFTGPLVIPKSLKVINSGGLEGNNFSSLLIESSNLRIGERAFYSSLRGGILEIPEGITSIGAEAFHLCQIESISFPESLEYIGTKAFEGCWYLTGIECLSSTPPQLGTGAFDDVPKDNFTIVVPASFVDDYQSATGWNEFKRIEAKRDFSISRRLFRTLNASNEKRFTLRADAGASWSIQEKPDWVTVEPLSGTGKTEVCITVAELPQGSVNRSGQIVYRLDGDGYTVATSLEQYDSPYADGDVIVNNTHSKGSGIPIVFLGDGYDAKDISEGKYTNDINEAIGHLFDIEPYKSYKDYFDVSVVIACSEDSGIQYSNIIRDTKFKTTYTQRYGLEADEDICDEYALKATNSLDKRAGIALICNTNQFTGKSYVYPDKRFLSICPVVNNPYPNDFRGIVQHEVGGHGFGKLGEECINYYTFIQTLAGLYQQFLIAKSYGWYENLAVTDDIKSVPWSHLMYDPDYSDLVDIYEGGFFCSRGVFRSESNSCMNNYVPYFSTISRESIVRRIMEYAGEPFTYEAFKEKDLQTINN